MHLIAYCKLGGEGGQPERRVKETIQQSIADIQVRDYGDLNCSSSKERLSRDWV